MTILDTRPVYALELRTLGTDSPRRARHWLAWVLESTGLQQDTVDTALLVVSELVTNAVVHSTSPRILVSLEVVPEGVRLVVHDDGDDWHTSNVGDPDERGRGLILVRALASLEIDRHRFGTTVSATIPGPVR